MFRRKAIQEAGLPDPRLCECGHRVTWFVPEDPDTQPNWYRSGYKMKQDVVERDCPHRNGTTIQYCPQCDRKVGIWGMGVAGAMECECWDSPRSLLRWWRLFRVK